jgi:tetratricopeptide (TPR) repeat protein
MSVKAMKRQRIWFAVWCYYLVTLLPVVGIVQVGGQAMADRYTYLPSLGPFLLAGVGSAWMYGRAIAGTASPRLVNRAGIAAVGAVFLVLSISTARQIGIWKDSMAVFDAILANDSRRSPMVYFHRGVAHQKGGKPERAVDDYTVAISLFPSYYDAFFGRGTAYEILGLYDQAIADYSVAISLRPASYEAYTNRGLAYKKTGRREESIADLNRAIALSSSAAKAYLNLGVLYFEEGRIADAVGHFSRAIAADPADPEAYANRGIGHAILGQSGAALRDFDKAIELRPDVSVFYYNRGKLFAGTGQRERARADFKKACELGDEAGCRALREGIAY